MFKSANNAICAWDRSVWGRMATSDHGLNPSWCYTALTRWQHNQECHPINVEMKTCHLDPCLLEWDWLPVGQCCPTDGGIGSVIIAGWRSGTATRGAVSSSPVVDVVEGTSATVLSVAWGQVGILILACWMSWIDYPWGSVVLPMEALAVWSSLEGGVESATRGAVSSSPVVDVVEGTSATVLSVAWGQVGILILACWMSWIDYPWGSVVLPMEALAVWSSLDGGVESATRGAVSSSPVVDVVEGTSVSVLLGLGCLGDRFCRSSDWWWNGVQTWRIQAGGHTICMTEGVQGVTGDL